MRGYLRTLRVLLVQTRDEVRASRVEVAEHLSRLEEIASAQLERLERLSAAAEAGNSAGPGERRDVGSPDELAAESYGIAVRHR